MRTLPTARMSSKGIYGLALGYALRRQNEWRAAQRSQRFLVDSGEWFFQNTFMTSNGSCIEQGNEECPRRRRNEMSVLAPLLSLYTTAYMALLCSDFLLRDA